jgi:hypothetical protein
MLPSYSTAEWVLRLFNDLLRFFYFRILLMRPLIDFALGTFRYFNEPVQHSIHLLCVTRKSDDVLIFFLLCLSSILGS